MEFYATVKMNELDPSTWIVQKQSQGEKKARWQNDVLECDTSGCRICFKRSERINTR